MAAKTRMMAIRNRPGDIKDEQIEIEKEWKHENPTEKPQD
jgi:hypothetical protein